MLHYLDDFLVIIPPGINPDPYSEIFDNLCKLLGFMINKSKEKIHIINDFLGIEIDTNLMEARLPREKLQKAIALVNAALKKRSIFIKNLQSLIGFLAFASRVVIPGKAFFRRLYDALDSQHKHVRLTSSIKQDLK